MQWIHRRECFDYTKTKKYHELVKKSIIYNNAAVYDSVKNKIIGGNITDKSLLKFITSSKEKIYKTSNYIPFNSKTKYSSVKLLDSNKLTLIKGSPDLILSKCNSYYDEFGVIKKFASKNSIIDLCNIYSRKCSSCNGLFATKKIGRKNCRRIAYV